MRSILVAACISLVCLAAPAQANPQMVEVGGQVFLVKDKAIAGADFGLFFTKNAGLHIDFALAFAVEDAPRNGLDSNFIGFLFGVHLQFRHSLSPNFDLRGGTGVDVWPLVGINSDEVKFGLPVFVAGHMKLSERLGLFLRPRFYLLKSDGLLPGEDFDGETQIPLLVSAGIAGAF